MLESLDCLVLWGSAMATLTNEWQLQEAKNKFSQVIKEADKGIPQFITVHGKQKVVVLSAEAYQKLIEPAASLSSTLLLPILDENDEDLFERSVDHGRDVEL